MKKGQLKGQKKSKKRPIKKSKKKVKKGQLNVLNLNKEILKYVYLIFKKTKQQLIQL